MKRLIMSAVSVVMSVVLATSAMAVCVAGDTTPPTQTTDLKVQSMSNGIFRATWTTPTDVSGIKYYLKTYKSNITALLWNTATALTGTVTPENFGAKQAMVTDVPIQTAYCFTLKSMDDCNKTSLVSNGYCMPTVFTDFLSFENQGINTKGELTGTLYLNTTKLVNGISILTAASPILELVGFTVSTRGNTLAALAEVNFDAAANLTNFQDNDPAMKNVIEKLFYKGKSVSIMTSVDTTPRTGKIALYDLALNMPAGNSTILSFVVDQLFDANGAEIVAPIKVLDVSVSR